MTTKNSAITALLIPAIIATVIINLAKDPHYKGQMVDAKFTLFTKAERQNREKILTAFFSKYKSPLAENVDKFLDTSDKYNLDYRLLPAISCMESSCAKKLIPDSYNPFGWGIYGNNIIKFSSYDNAIEAVGAGLHKNYISRGLDTPEEIELIYTPLSKGHWVQGVRFFMNQMDNIEITGI